jgi:hypothetical protein
VDLFPVPGNVDAAADPDPVVPGDVVQKALQRQRRPGLPSRRQCMPMLIILGGIVAFGVQHIKAVAQVGEEVLALLKPWGNAKRMSLVSSV